MVSLPGFDTIDVLGIDFGPAVQLITAGECVDTTLLNFDQFDTVYVGASPAIQPTDQSGIAPLSPGATLTFDGTEDVYGICQPGATALVAKFPSAIGASPGPALVASALAPLAVLIAQSIAASGIQLIANPTLLYNQQTINAGTPGLVGATIDNANYSTPTVDAAIAQFVANCGRTPTCGKVYYQASNTWPSGIDSKLQPYIDNNMTCYLCFQPAFNPPTVAEKTKINTMLSALSAAGLKAVAVPWQELGQGQTPPMTSAQFKTMIQFYANTDANGTGIRNHYKLAINYDGNIGTSTSAASWFPGTGTQFVDIIGVDMYATRYNTGGRVDAAGGAMSVADANGLPFGWFEISSLTFSNQSLPNSTVLACLNYAQSVFGTRLTGGKPNDALMWWNGGNSPGNVPKVPQDVLGVNDFRTPVLQSWFDTLTQPPSSPLTIAAGGGKDIVPQKPSPIAGFASANFMSYDITIQCLAGALSTNPFLSVVLSWFNTDSATALAVHSVQWNIPMGANNTTGTVITGRGPMRAQWMKVRVINRDTVTATVLNVQVNGTGRTIERDDWFWDVAASVAVPGYTLAGTGASNANNIGSVNAVSINAGASSTFLLGLFSGNVFARLGTSAGANLMDCQLNPQPTSQFGTGAMFHEFITNPTGGNSSEIYLSDMVFPRGPVAVKFTNNDSVSRQVNAQFNILD